MFSPFSWLCTRRTLAWARLSGSGNERKETKRKRTGQEFLLSSRFHFLRAQFSFLSFIFFALSFLFSLSFSPRSVFFSLVPTNWEPAIMRALWGTLEEARAPKLTWAPGHPDFELSASKELIVLHQSDLMSVYNRVVTKGRGGGGGQRFPRLL